MLAFIPSHCVLAESTAGSQWTDILRTLESLRRDNDGLYDDTIHWSVVLTAYAQRAIKDKVSWSEWIQTWQGPGAPSLPDLVSDQERTLLAQNARSSPKEVQRALQLRYRTFEYHQRLLERLGCSKSNELYGIVLSRAADLGPQWNHELGIIPFHDMLNHPPTGEAKSVELFTIGEIRRLTSTEHVCRLALKSFLDKVPSNLRDKDIVIVARRTISPGEELFISYTGVQENLSSEDDRIWKMLQYGFPLDAAP
jgi:hypothetical protein